jgi:hypothetical protein
MNRVFMQEYYNLRYQDTLMPLIIERSEECRKLYHKIMGLEGQTEQIMRGIGDECLMVHGQLFVAKGEFESLIISQAYLQGAEDRERMLK